MIKREQLAIEALWAGHAAVRAGESSGVFGAQTEAEILKTSERLLGRGREAEVACPSSSPAHAAAASLPVPFWVSGEGEVGQGGVEEEGVSLGQSGSYDFRPPRGA